MSIPRVTPEQVQAFVDYLSKNAPNRARARTWREIVAEMGDLRLVQNGDRKLRALANAANKAGHLVCTGNSGYWLATSAEDIRETAGRLRSQAQKMLKRATEIETLGLAKFQDGRQWPTVRPARQMAVSEFQMPLV